MRDPGDAEDILQDVLPAIGADPEAAFERSVVLEELQRALDELPPISARFLLRMNSKAVGKGYRVQLGVGINTLLARKRYAVCICADACKRRTTNWIFEGGTDEIQERDIGAGPY